MKRVNGTKIVSFASGGAEIYRGRRWAELARLTPPSHKHEEGLDTKCCSLFILN